MISKFASDILDKLVIEIKKEENINKIHKNIVDPIILYSFQRVYPYLLITFIIFLLTFILAILIFVYLIRFNKNLI